MTIGSTSHSSYLRTVAITIFAITCACITGTAQESPGSARVRQLGDQLLQALGRFQSAHPAGQSAIRSEASALIQERAAALAALVEDNPAAALRRSFPADVAARLSAAFPSAAAQIESHGMWEGPIEYIVEDDQDFARHRNIRTMSVGGELLRVYFADGEPDGLKNGDVLGVKGVRVGNVLASSDSSIVAASAIMCSTIGAQKSIVLLVTMPGWIPPDPPAPNPLIDINAEGVSDIFFNTIPNNEEVRSLSGYWHENSYGQTWAEGDVRGW